MLSAFSVSKPKSRLRSGTPLGARAVVDMLLLWRERARQRSKLARLDDRMLRDIGVTRADAARELGKPFWRD